MLALGVYFGRGALDKQVGQGQPARWLTAGRQAPVYKKDRENIHLFSRICLRTDQGEFLLPSLKCQKRQRNLSGDFCDLSGVQ